MSQPFDIVGYTYQADNYCPEDIIEVIDRFASVGDPTTDVEYRLDYIANDLGINRQDESSFDSGDFPKVLFRDQARDGERCGTCGKVLAQ